MKKLDIKPLIESLIKMSETPKGKLGGAGWATVTSPLPNVRIKTADGVEIPTSLIEVSPFCEEWKSKLFKHKHKYDDHDTGEGSGDSRENVDTTEELLEILMWRGIKKGDTVCYVRTNESQKYLLLWRNKMWENN